MILADTFWISLQIFTPILHCWSAKPVEKIPFQGSFNFICVLDSSWRLHIWKDGNWEPQWGFRDWVNLHDGLHQVCHRSISQITQPTQHNLDNTTLYSPHNQTFTSRLPSNLQDPALSRASGTPSLAGSCLWRCVPIFLAVTSVVIDVVDT